MASKLQSLRFALSALLAATAHAQQVNPAGALTGDPFGSGAEADPFADLVPEAKVTDDKKGRQSATHPAPRLNLRGYLESRNQLRIGADQEAISTRQRLWLEVDGILLAADATVTGREVRFFGSGGLDIDPAAADLSDDHEKVRADSEELYLTVDTADLDIIVGRQMLRWGTGDGINPLDLINPLDYRDPIASGRVDSRVPVVLGRAMLRLPTVGPLQEASFEAVLVPLAQVNQLNAPGSAWEGIILKELRAADAQGALVLADQQQPEDVWNDAEFAARLAVTAAGWDLALIGFRGNLDSPVFARDLILDASGAVIPRLTPIHPRFSAFGINVAKGLEHSTLRGELALKPDLPVMLADASAMPGYVRRSVIEGVVGVDRTFGISLYTNLQYFFTFIDDAANLVRDRYEHGVTYEVHDLFLHDALQAGVRGVASFTDQSWTFEAYSEYSLGDDWLLAASLLFFEGPEVSRFGQFTDNDMLTLRLRYSF
jgi:hypothetical protein